MGAPCWKPGMVEELRSLHAQGLTDNEIAERIGVTSGSVTGKRTRLGLPCNISPYHVEYQMPESFPEVMGLPREELIARFGVSRSVIVKWRKKCGFVYCHPKKAERVSKPRARTWKQWQNTMVIPEIDGSLAYQAVRHLQRYFVPVCKLSTIKRDADPNIYLVGHMKLTSGELIDLAEDKGFRSEFSTCTSTPFGAHKSIKSAQIEA